MTQDTMASIIDPAGYLTRHALASIDRDGRAGTVGQNSPLPVTPGFGTAGSTPLVGSAAGSGSFGPFKPDLGRPIWLTLSGSWAGSVTVLRSTDAGATRLALTLGGDAWGSYTANVQEVLGEESVAGATYYLAAAVTGGSLAFEVRQ